MAWAIGLMVAALVSIGAAAGYSVGLSQTPVVATLLPLLFGLIAGGSGFLLLKTDFGNEAERKNVMPALGGIAVFALSYLGAMAHGTSIRSPSLPEIDHPAFPERLTISQSTALIQSRKVLAASGASKDEQSAVIGAFLDRVQAKGEEELPSIVRCRRMKIVAQDFVQALSIPPEHTGVDEAELDNLAALASEISGLASALEVCDSEPDVKERVAATISNAIGTGIAEALERSVISRRANAAFDSPWNALAAFPEASARFGILYVEIAVPNDERSPFLELQEMSELPFSIQALPLETGGRSLASTNAEDKIDEDTDLNEQRDRSRLPG